MILAGPLRQPKRTPLLGEEEKGRDMIVLGELDL
jgi:hypothetical protein